MQQFVACNISTPRTIRLNQIGVQSRFVYEMCSDPLFTAYEAKPGQGNAVGHKPSTSITACTNACGAS
jgi:hypothetical protein